VHLIGYVLVYNASFFRKYVNRVSFELSKGYVVSLLSGLACSVIVVMYSTTELYLRHSFPAAEHYLIANAKFMLDDEEHFQEQMKEKLRMYGERDKEQDFWMVIEPEFLDKHPDVAKRVSKPAAALVSTDKVWIT
jgi:hypothetical protein